MLADVGVESGAEKEYRFFSVDVIQPLKRIVNRIVEAGFAVGGDSHPPEAVEKLVLVLCKIRQDLRPYIKRDKGRPIVRPKAVDKTRRRADHLLAVIAECVAELPKNSHRETPSRP